MGLLDGKVAVITGAGGGIGRAHALAFAKEGARIVVNDLGTTPDGSGVPTRMADAVVAEIRALGGEAVASVHTVTSMEGAAAIIGTAIDTFGRVDILVNNAGILRDKTVWNMSEEMWDAVIDVHLKGTFACGQAAIRWMRDNGVAGRIINTSSYAGLKGNFGQTNYAAAKAGIYALSMTWSQELRKNGITVNVLAPMAKTRMTEEIALIPEDFRPEHVAPVAVFLASDLAKDVTGRVFGVHGSLLLEYRMEMSAGVDKGDGAVWDPREIADKLDEIGRFGGASTGTDLEELAKRMPARKASGRARSELVGKTYEVSEKEVTADAIITYAQAIDETKSIHRVAGSTLVAPPLFPVTLLMRVLRPVVADPELGIDMLRMVHGEQGFRFHAPMRPGDRVRGKARVAGIEEKSSGTTYRLEFEFLRGDETLVTGESVLFVRGPSSGTSGAPEKKAETAETRPPAFVTSITVADDQSRRYAPASGDMNPIHLDPAVAKKAGLKDIILHGLCSMALACRGLVDQHLGGDPSRLESLFVRFSKPVYMGDILTTTAWVAEESAGHRTLDLETRNQHGEVVLAKGRATIHP